MENGRRNDYEDRITTIKSYEEGLDLIFKILHFDILDDINFVSIAEINEAQLPRQGGIYIFYKDEEAIYVGRTKNIRARIQNHIRDSSKHESATFVFNLAKMYFIDNNRADIFRTKGKKRTRAQLMKVKEFKNIFDEQKKVLKSMKLKYFVLEHDILQTMVEPYLAYKLKTYPKHNNFETH